ncbi:CPBP family intramembrane glutamic endopeptidase [Paenibacillus thermotolerans]|uniref:CPBP family intramembrane glutamic endopeptidase n=1 Tax=Paenibacillus thermotolerans TaxID=3027807 RepID=UPI002367BF83|nr:MULTISPECIES: type II CAAX endopeptidase family protein [unclassified Paenibacillus]
MIICFAFCCARNLESSGGVKKSLVFLLVNFLITWIPWIVVAVTLDHKMKDGEPLFVLYILGGLLGPVLSALIAQRFFGPKSEFKAFLKQIIKFKAPWIAYPFVIFIPLVFSLLSQVVDGAKLDFPGPYYMVLLTIPMFMIGGGLEEVGWRGVLLPELLKKFSPIKATIVVSVFWAIWHIPLWFINGTVQTELNFWWFCASVLWMSVLLSVVYIATNSVFLCILMHALFNSNNAYFSTVVPSNEWTEPVGTIIKIALSLCVFIIVLNMKRKRHVIVSESVLN